MADDVCVVTQPLGDADPTATGDLLAILSAITDVSLVTMALGDDALADRYEVVELDTRDPPQRVWRAALLFLANQLRMARELRRREESVVLFFGPIAYVLPILVARLSGKRVIVQPRADVPLALRLRWERRLPGPIARVLARLVWLLERIGYRLAHAIVTYTPAMATSLGLDPYEAKLYSDGARFVDDDRFSPRTAFEDRERIVGYLGRLHEEKGIRRFVRAVQRLPDDVRVRIVGDGDLREWAADALSQRRADGTVEFRGWVDHDDVPDELSAFQLLVLPSYAAEGLPTTILESFACGTPVYATPVSGVPDVVRDGETGAVMESTEPERIAARIESLLDGDDLGRMSQQCRDLIESEFTFEAAVQRYEHILSDH